MRALIAFVLVFAMGVNLRFAPQSNWVWWVDLIWIALVSTAVFLPGAKGQNNER